jgi:hypothetical protein
MLDERVHVLADGVEVRVGDLLLLAELANHGSDLVVVGVVDTREQVVFDLKVTLYRYRVTYLVLRLKHLFLYKPVYPNIVFSASLYLIFDSFMYNECQSQKKSLLTLLKLHSFTCVTMSLILNSVN